MATIFYKQGVQAATASPVQAAKSTKREAPAAWANVKYKKGSGLVSLNNKFIRIDAERDEEAFLLEAYENAYNIFIEEADTKGKLKNKPEDFVFRISSVIEIVPANGLTKKTVEGDLVMEA